MPQNVSFHLPFPTGINPEAERARERHLDWVTRLGLIEGDEALRRYRASRLTDLVAYAYPDAAGADLDLVTDAVCLGFPLDDEFDGPLGRHPRRAELLCAELAAIPYREPGASPRLDIPLTRAYADVWRRSAAGMSAAWRARAAADYARFFRAYVQETRNRILGRTLDEDSYVALRRQAVGTAPCFDLIERAGHFEVPSRAYHSREVQALTRCAGDIVFLCNDVHSVEREEAQGDPHNLVLIRQRALGCDRAEALRQVGWEIERRVRTFLRLAAALPGRQAAWGLDARGRAHLARYLAGLGTWMTANQRWGRATARYAERSGLV